MAAKETQQRPWREQIVDRSSLEEFNDLVNRISASDRDAEHLRRILASTTMPDLNPSLLEGKHDTMGENNNEPSWISVLAGSDAPRPEVVTAAIARATQTKVEDARIETHNSNSSRNDTHTTHHDSDTNVSPSHLENGTSSGSTSSSSRNDTVEDLDEGDVPDAEWEGALSVLRGAELTDDEWKSLTFTGSETSDGMRDGEPWNMSVDSDPLAHVRRAVSIISRQVIRNRRKEQRDKGNQNQKDSAPEKFEEEFEKVDGKGRRVLPAFTRGLTAAEEEYERVVQENIKELKQREKEKEKAKKDKGSAERKEVKKVLAEMEELEKNAVNEIVEKDDVVEEKREAKREGEGEGEREDDMGGNRGKGKGTSTQKDNTKEEPLMGKRKRMEAEQGEEEEQEEETVNCKEAKKDQGTDDDDLLDMNDATEGDGAHRREEPLSANDLSSLMNPLATMKERDIISRLADDTNNTHKTDNTTDNNDLNEGKRGSLLGDLSTKYDLNNVNEQSKGDGLGEAMTKLGMGLDYNNNNNNNSMIGDNKVGTFSHGSSTSSGSNMDQDLINMKDEESHNSIHDQAMTDSNTIHKDTSDGDEVMRLLREAEERVEAEWRSIGFDEADGDWPDLIGGGGVKGISQGPKGKTNIPTFTTTCPGPSEITTKRTTMSGTHLTPLPGQSTPLPTSMTVSIDPFGLDRREGEVDREGGDNKEEGEWTLDEQAKEALWVIGKHKDIVKGYKKVLGRSNRDEGLPRDGDIEEVGEEGEDADDVAGDEGEALSGMIGGLTINSAMYQHGTVGNNSSSSGDGATSAGDRSNASVSGALSRRIPKTTTMLIEEAIQELRGMKGKSEGEGKRDKGIQRDRKLIDGVGAMIELERTDEGYLALGAIVIDTGEASQRAPFSMDKSAIQGTLVSNATNGEGSGSITQASGQLHAIHEQGTGDGDET